MQVTRQHFPGAQSIAAMPRNWDASFSSRGSIS
jgi:hypothetical protein